MSDADQESVDKAIILIEQMSEELRISRGRIKTLESERKKWLEELSTLAFRAESAEKDRKKFEKWVLGWQENYYKVQEQRDEALERASRLNKELEEAEATIKRVEHDCVSICRF